jgi:hypothetical protein
MNRAKYRPPQTHHWHDPQRCEHCGAADSRDANHARGCPKLPQLSTERLLELALACERGWHGFMARRAVAAPAVQAARAHYAEPARQGEGVRGFVDRARRANA